MRRLSVGCCAAVVFFALLVSSAGAVDIVEAQLGNGEDPGAGWQAGVCTEDPCSAQTPELFFKQAAGHPPDAFTQVLIKEKSVGLGTEPVGSAKTLLVDLPAGLSVNPQATPQCELVEGKIPAGGCPANTRVGTSNVVAAALGPIQTPFPGLPVYNIKPRPGEPARFGFVLSTLGFIELGDVFLNAGVAWQSDYHEYFTIHVPNPLGAKLVSDRLFFDGTTETQAGGGQFLTNPSTCNDAEVEPFRLGYATTLHADSREEEAPEDEYDVAAPAFPPARFLSGSQKLISYLPKGAKPEGCAKVPFTPTAQTTPNTAVTDSASNAQVEVKVPFAPQAAVYQSNVKTARVSLPLGMGLNPAAAPALATCTEAQFGRGTRGPVACPAASRLGEVEIETPVLPAGTLKGSAYLAPQASSEPESGSLYRLWLEAGSAERGVSVRLLANVAANKATGRLTATIENAPQLPFSAFRVKLNAKPISPLISPPTCGPNVTNHGLDAWSGTPDGGATEPGFTLANAPGGGACARTGAERPFKPGFAAAPATTTAKSSTSYTLKLERKDGEQELKGIDVTLPEGTTARLRGVAYCKAAEIAAASTGTGRAQIAKPSCPGKSFIGTVKVATGAGANPLGLAGNAYLSGPYKGAPLSMTIVTPAVAGPFDLGNVVVRAALFLEPESGQVHVVSDPIPDVYGGAKLDLRSLTVDLSRKYFVRNGTGCAATTVGGTLAGGGNEPANAAGFSSVPVSAPAKTTGCGKLQFKPRLKLTLSGATKRAKNPHLHAVLKARSQKDADIGFLSVGLPHALFLDQASLGGVCTRTQFPGKCPKKSVYGHAKAWSPLLGKPLSGPVYLRSSNHKLPDLVAHLKGQVTIDLDGKIDSFKGGIRTSFESVPDLPVSKFELDLPGGKGGLLENSRNLCKTAVEATVIAKAHNGKKANLSGKVGVGGCGGGKKGSGGKKKSGGSQGGKK
jgi:hypothetical protein